jgi:hypothetical protein
MNKEWNAAIRAAADAARASSSVNIEEERKIRAAILALLRPE